MSQFRIMHVFSEEHAVEYPATPRYESLAVAYHTVCDAIGAEGGSIVRTYQERDSIIVMGRANGCDVAFIIEPVN